MKGNSIRNRVLMAGIALPALTFLLGVPIHAQTAKGDTPPGMGETDSPFGGGTHRGPTTFGGKSAPADKPAVSSFPAEIHGVTRYPNGLAMPGAKVLILNADADVDRTIVSGNDGTFVFKNLKPGEYQVTASKDGFALSPVSKVELAYGKIATVDVHLGPSLAVSPVNPNPSQYRLQPVNLRVASARTETDEPVPSTSSTASESAKPSTAAAEQPIPAAVADQLDAMRRRIDELETALKARLGSESPAEAPAAAVVAGAPQDAQAPATPKPGPGQYLATGGTISYFKGDTDIPDRPAGWEPFSYADWTWMNAAGRQHDSPWSSKYFTPEFRADVNFMDSLNHPIDDTMGGSTESFRTNEWQLEQMSLGGDIRLGHVRGRILTMFGLFATTTPRNDGSTARGQWDLRDAYRYISEGWGGYHWDNVGHGLNIDAGIFVSYIGLFSYYNFDNWTYQPSYVSSNTPWFFNGLRIQYFPTAKLKIEPWIINGWQSYARYNSKPGLGGQILWRPDPWLSFVFNNYGMGTDVLGNPAVSRIHTDDSVEVREYNQPDKFMDMAAMSFTTDAGCQYGGGQNCFNDKNGGIKTSFLGWMVYQRLQFKHDMYGLTFGGGYMNNPGRYLTLLQPINGADAISGSPYFTENPGDKAHMYDATITADYMPSQWLTFRGEVGYRHSDVPYFSGHGGITPPGGNNGFPNQYACSNGAASGVISSGSVVADLPSVEAVCAPLTGNAGAKSVWFPDLRREQTVFSLAIMTRF